MEEGLSYISKEVSLSQEIISDKLEVIVLEESPIILQRPSMSSAGVALRLCVDNAACEELEKVLERL